MSLDNKPAFPPPSEGQEKAYIERMLERDSCQTAQLLELVEGVESWGCIGSHLLAHTSGLTARVGFSRGRITLHVLKPAHSKLVEYPMSRVVPIIRELLPAKHKLSDVWDEGYIYWVWDFTPIP